MEKLNLCGKFSQVYCLECEWGVSFHGAVSSWRAFVEEIVDKIFVNKVVCHPFPSICCSTAAIKYTYCIIAIDAVHDKMRWIYLLAMIVPGGFLIGAGYVPCDHKYVGIIMMTAAGMFMSLRVTAYAPNIPDIAAR